MKTGIGTTSESNKGTTVSEILNTMLVKQFFFDRPNDRRTTYLSVFACRTKIEL